MNITLMCLFLIGLSIALYHGKTAPDDKERRTWMVKLPISITVCCGIGYAAVVGWQSDAMGLVIPLGLPLYYVSTSWRKNKQEEKIYNSYEKEIIQRTKEVFQEQALDHWVKNCFIRPIFRPRKSGIRCWLPARLQDYSIQVAIYPNDDLMQEMRERKEALHALITHRLQSLYGHVTVFISTPNIRPLDRKRKYVS